MSDQQIQARFTLAHPGFNMDVDLQLPGHGVSAVSYTHLTLPTKA